MQLQIMRETHQILSQASEKNWTELQVFRFSFFFFQLVFHGQMIFVILNCFGLLHLKCRKTKKQERYEERNKEGSNEEQKGKIGEQKVQNEETKMVKMKKHKKIWSIFNNFLRRLLMPPRKCRTCNFASSSLAPVCLVFWSIQINLKRSYLRLLVKTPIEWFFSIKFTTNW